MGKTSQSWVTWISWSFAVVSVTITALLWLFATFTPREKLEDYQKHMESGFKNLHSDIDDIKASVIRIENRLDRVKLGAAVGITNTLGDIYGKRR